MDFLKNHWIRLAYSILSALIFLFAIYLENVIVKDQIILNKVSYYGTIATVIALVITILEVAHNIRIASGIQKEAKRLLAQVQSVDQATSFSECLSALDDANEYISEEKFFLALKCFQYFRKTHSRFSSSYEAEAEVAGLVGKIELALQRATHATASAPITKTKKSNILEDILTIKDRIEKAALLRKDLHVPT